MELVGLSVRIALVAIVDRSLHFVGVFSILLSGNKYQTKTSFESYVKYSKKIRKLSLGLGRFYLISLLPS